MNDPTIRSPFLRFSRGMIACILASLLAACGGGGSSAPVVSATSGAGGAINALNVIPEVDSINGVATLTLTAKFDATGRPAFFYNGQKTAPTIRVQPGDSIHLEFINQLPQFCAAGVQTDSNLHFHGLNSAPVQPGDEVITTLAAPGNTLNYTVVINPDQPSGLYWYHPHPHGLSSYEVGNGMAGAIIVDGIANSVPQTAGLRERTIILGDVPNNMSFTAGEESRYRKAETIRRVQDDDSASVACAPETNGTPMINGQSFASIGIKPGETELFRVVNASGHRHFNLSFDSAPMQIVAQDGVPIGEYPGAPQSLTATNIVIPPAGRVEFLITGKTSPISMTSLCYNAGPAGDANPQVVLGALVNDSNWPASLQTAVKRVPAAAKGLRRSLYYATSMPAPSAQRTIRFSEDANGFYLDGQAYNPSGPPSIVAHSGTTEEWTLENDSDEVHAFHIHQTHFIVESINGQTQSNPHWLDTIDIPAQAHGVQGQVVPATVKVLIDFRDPTIRGTFLYHCHILDHEDGGMMAKIQVIS